MSAGDGGGSSGSAGASAGASPGVSVGASPGVGASASAGAGASVAGSGERARAYGPTVVELDLDGLDKVTALAVEAGRAAVHAHASMASADLGPLAFGAMNAPLGLAATALAARASSLTRQVGETAPAFAQATRGAARTWRTVEEQAAAALARLAGSDEEERP